MNDSDLRLRAIRRSMGLSDRPPVPIENPMQQVRVESMKDQKIRLAISIIAMLFIIAFIIVLLVGL